MSAHGYVSPYVAAAAARCKAPAQEMETFYILRAQWPREVRRFTIEWPEINTAAEALDAIRQNERVVQALRCDPDCAPRDVSEDLARTMLTAWIEGGGNPEEDDMPEFIAANISHSEAVAMFSENYPELEAAQ